MDSAQISWIQRKYEGFDGNLMDSAQISWIQRKSNGFGANLMDSAQISWIQRKYQGLSRGARGATESTRACAPLAGASVSLREPP